MRREYFLEKASPDLKEVRACLIRIVDGVHRTSDVLDGIRSLFQGTNQSRDQIDLNEITLEVLEPMGAEFKNHAITTLPRLTTNIPRFHGNRRQLQEVIVNLLHNAIEAMDIMTDRNRVLRLKTERRGIDAIVLSVEDSGPGVDPKNLESIFDAFVTTKRHGMGLGLAICRVIVN
jgi:C4-dicarboxylate-specific signal transduction histidine kinase